MNSVEILSGLSPDEIRDLPVELRCDNTGEIGAWEPLSHGQRALWLINQLAPQSPAYNLMYACRICSELNIPALRSSFQALIDRHASLRTIYRDRDGAPMQYAKPHMAISFEIRDASAWGDEELRDRVMDAAHRPFNLSEGPLLRAHLFSRAGDEHTLLLVVHHIGADFASVITLVNELMAVYQARLAGVEAALPELKAGYTDFAHWQSELLAGAEGESLWGYWREQLGGELPALDLPADRPRQPVQTYEGDTHTFHISADLTAGLNRLAWTSGTTLYVILLASFNALLHRYTGQKDILVGSPADGRRRADEGIVGYFANTLVLRADLSGDPVFRDFLRQARQTTLGALAHRDYPFSLLVEKLQPARDASRSPLTDIMFTFRAIQAARGADGVEEAPPFDLSFGDDAMRARIGGMELAPYALKDQASQVDLTVRLVERSGSVFALLYYNTDLLDRATIARMMDSYLILLEGVVTDPDARLSELPLMSEKERRRVLVEWNDTGTGRTGQGREENIHSLFEAQVERTPERIAVVSAEGSLTYLELNRRANQVARRLRRLGVGADMRVGVCLERSCDMLVAVMGALKAGAAYVPLDPSYPEERLSFMLEDARVPVLLTERSLAARLSRYVKHVVCFDADGDILARERAENLACDAEGANLAYVIYTSGSTGRPKGVMIEHRSAINFAKAHQLAIYRERADECLQASFNATLAFDAAVERILLLLYGHTIHVWSEELRHDPHALISYVRRREMDVLDFSPSQLRLLIEAGLFDPEGFAPSLVIVGGEAIDDRLWRSLAANLQTEIFNVYGPTECTVNSAACRVRSSPTQPSIGRPLANVQIYILDESLRPAPVGAPGEIYIGGAGLARGYLQRPGLTAEKFIPNPYSQSPGARLYKTSDRARFLSDGRIKFLDRADDQVKIRGFRIELGEVEAALGECPLVKQAVVVAREVSPGDKRLVAYVVLREPGPSAIGGVKRFLREIVPQYMAPSAYVVLNALPLMPNGKLDRKALPSLSPTERHAGEDYEAPQTSMEKQLAQLWERILRVERIGRRDNFFELGGHSLLATQMIIYAREAFNVELPLRHIFESPTVAEFAVKVMEGRLERQGGGELEAIIGELERLPDEDAQRLLEKQIG
jgi:amino acid adenylation domain-containing protein